MVDFDAAVAAVQDPNADPVFLAKIAYENPEFGANVVANPRAYPGLKRWVAQFGDERARQQLVAMGWPVPQDVSSSARMACTRRSIGNCSPMWRPHMAIRKSPRICWCSPRSTRAATTTSP